MVPPEHISLPFWMCFFLNSENKVFPTLEENKFYKCKLVIRYLLDTECTLRDGSLFFCGYWICVGVGALIILLANFGIVTNILNLLVLPKSLNGCSVKRLMVLLAVFDLLASICAIPVTLLLLLILGKYERGMEALEAFQILYLLFSLGRTGSIFVTIMIAIERYIAIGFPLKSWLTPRKSRIHLVILMSIISLLNLPWWLNKTLERNETFMRSDLGSNTSSSDNNTSAAVSNELTEFPYIYKGTTIAYKVYPKIRFLHVFIDFAFPFPLLLIFNGLLYRSIYLANKARQTLTTSQRREVNAAKMFSIVALILLLCHTVAVVLFVLTQVHRINYRELQFIQILATSLNASINFVIYYVFGKSFRDEFWTLIQACKLFRNKVEMATVTPSSSHGTTEMGVVAQARQFKQQSQRAR